MNFPQLLPQEKAENTPCPGQEKQGAVAGGVLQAASLHLLQSIPSEEDQDASFEGQENCQRTFWVLMTTDSNPWTTPL